MFSFSYALVLVIYLSDLKAGSTNTHSEGALKPDKPKQQISCIYKHTVACCKTLGFLALNFTMSKHLIRDPDSLFQEPVWSHTLTAHWTLPCSGFRVLQSFSKHNHFTVTSLPWDVLVRSWTILSVLVTPRGILLNSNTNGFEVWHSSSQHQCLSSLKTSRPQ